MSNQAGTCSDKHHFWLQNVRCPTTISSTGLCDKVGTPGADLGFSGGGANF